jgi:hypothetical protein
MRSPVRRIQWAILEAVNILEEELASDPAAASDIDQDDVDRTVLIFDDLQKLLQGKGLIPEARRARSLDRTRRSYGRRSRRSSSLPTPGPTPQPKVRSKTTPKSTNNHRKPNIEKKDSSSTSAFFFCSSFLITIHQSREEVAISLRAYSLVCS